MSVSNLDELRALNVRMVPQQFLQGNSNSVSQDSELEGGALKASDVLGSVAGISGGLSAIPGAAIITAPIAAIAGIGASIAKLFGGSLTQGEVDMLMQIKGRVDHRRNLQGVVGDPN